MKNQLRKLIRETIKLDINVGDEILAGRFKNKKVIVKDIGEDKDNQPTINGKTILKFKIKKLIHEELDNLFETLGFQYSAQEQLATNRALYEIPRKGIHDSINRINQVEFDLNKMQSDEEREDSLDDKFTDPAPNIPMATVSTNIYEDVTNPMAAQKNLDRIILPSPATASYSKATQDEFDLNNNIELELKLGINRPGEAAKGVVSINKSKSF